MAKNARSSVTIKDVAAHAGVSLATASRALSSQGYVSIEAKQRVSDAARELGYKLHSTARSLKLQRSDTVGLMVADISNPFYSYLADGVLDAAQRLGYHVILAATGEEPAIEREYLEVLLQKRVDGIIAVPTAQNIQLWQEAINLGTKLVFVDRDVVEVNDTGVVLIDNVKGAFDATTYLIGLGHRRIGIINGPVTTTTGAGRLRGYRDALAAAQIPFDPAIVRIGTFKRENGFEAAHTLLSLDSPPTAIFATNNVLGEATMFALREKGLRVPDDISLIVFDDVPWTRLTNPRITVVAQPTYDLGLVGMERLAQRLQETQQIKRDSLRTMLPTELIVRESCRSISRIPLQIGT